MALRMAIKAQLNLPQPPCGMRHFGNSGNISSLYEDESSGSTLYSSRYRLLVRKTLYLDIEPSTLGAESENVYIFTYQVTKE